MKTIATVYFYESSSNADKLYQCLQYEDGTLSCDCPGWCKRAASDGTRTCKHTRLVAAGMGEQTAKKVVKHRQLAAASPAPARATSRGNKIDEATGRKFDFSE